MTRLTLLLPGLVLLTAACSGRHDTGSGMIPRREAHYRITAYDSATVDVRLPLVTLAVNAAAAIDTVTADSHNMWINVTYPRYGAVIRYTVTTGDAAILDKAIDNRQERMRLNAGSSHCEVSHFINPSGAEGVIWSHPTASVTPLQMLATDGKTYMVSGTVEMNDSNIERAAPIVEILRRDMNITARSL